MGMLQTLQVVKNRDRLMLSGDDTVVKSTFDRI